MFDEVDEDKLWVVTLCFNSLVIRLRSSDPNTLSQPLYAPDSRVSMYTLAQKNKTFLNPTIYFLNVTIKLQGRSQIKFQFPEFF